MDTEHRSEGDQMKVGDLVRLTTEPSIQQVWIISDLKSDTRGIWLQFNEAPSDTWHSAAYYEVVNESR